MRSPDGADPAPDYAALHPLRFHIAFAATDPDAAKADLLAAGATFVNENNYPDGRLMMLRDPWVLALQLVKRATLLLQRAARPAARVAPRPVTDEGASCTPNLWIGRRGSGKMADVP